ncbi:MAG: sigma-70 family RNA polymerase sigma factor [Planctomycetota bacterium]
MDETRQTLIQRIACGEPGAWVEANAIYAPLIRNWLGRYRLQPSDVDDVTQEVMKVLVAQIKDFEHNGRTGAFRNWLRTTTVNIARNSLRKRNTPVGGGGTDFQIAMAELEDPHSKLSKEFDDEHNRHVVKYLLKEIATEFKPITMRVFKMHVVDGVSVDGTADSLGVSRASVHASKSRVLRKLRQRAGELLVETL